MPATGPQVTAWCFTLHSPTPDANDHPKNWQGYKYLIYQLEQCPDTGRYHWQGYVIWHRKKTLAACKKIHDTAHWEPRNGPHEKARDYCKKEDTRVAGDDLGNDFDPGPHEFGDEPAPGTRVDLLELKAAVDDGASELELYNQNFGSMVRNGNGILRYRSLIIAPRNTKTEVAVFYGPTGTGKTYYIQQNIPQDKCFWLSRARGRDDPWMDGYDPAVHEHVVLDDFYGWIRWDTLLRMLDAYPLRLEIKGGTVVFKPKYIWITSNNKPEDWYNTMKLGQDFATLLRRINVIWHFKARDDRVIEREQF